MNTKLDAAISDLADLFEYGHLMASTAPAEFLDQVVHEITSLRTRLALLEGKEET